jgi:hypothetical protein
MQPDFKIEGVDKLLKACEQLKRPSAVKRVITAALTGALNTIGKQMKKDLSPKVKLGRAAVKSRIQYRGGKVTAKVGFGVGKRRKKTDKQKLAQANRKVKRGKKPGLGIGVNNVSWWIAGTKQRKTGFRKAGGYRIVQGVRAPSHSTGSMPAQQPKLAWMAYQKTKSVIHVEMTKRGAKALNKEVAKLKK